MPKTAKDVMQSQVVTLSPNDPLHTVQRLFYEEGIHGAPVVDEQGRVLGIITSTDILRAAAEADDGERGEPSYYREDVDISVFSWGDMSESFKERLQDVIVSDFMTEGVIHVGSDTPIPQIARALREHRIHRLLVVDNGALRGIVTTFDLIGLLEQSG
jgi:CBS domain-containing protein